MQHSSMVIKNKMLHYITLISDYLGTIRHTHCFYSGSFRRIIASQYPIHLLFVIWRIGYGDRKRWQLWNYSYLYNWYLVSSYQYVILEYLTLGIWHLEIWRWRIRDLFSVYNFLHAICSIFATKETSHHWHNIVLKAYRLSKQLQNILFHYGFHLQM